MGSKLHEHRGAFRLSYPMEHGVVVDWQDMEKVCETSMIEQDLCRSQS